MDNWKRLAQQSSDYELMQAITGGGRWTQNRMSLAVRSCCVSAGENVLDFGCGLGRNAPLLRESFLRVYGYDVKEMIARLGGSPLRMQYDALYDELGAAPEIHAVYDSVTWQHITDEREADGLSAVLHGMDKLSLIVSLRLDGMECAMLQRMKLRGWKTWTIELDFESLPRTHRVEVLKR